MQLKTALQKSQTVKKCGKKGYWKWACQRKNVHEVISSEIVSNDLFLGEISIENVESHPWEAML